MGRNQTDARKASGREALRTEWPRAWSEKAPEVECHFVIIDMTQTFQSIQSERVSWQAESSKRLRVDEAFANTSTLAQQNGGSRAMARSIREVIRELRRPVMPFLRAGMTVVMNFDKYGSPLSKVATQRMRRSHAENTGKGLFRRDFLEPRGLAMADFRGMYVRGLNDTLFPPLLECLPEQFRLKHLVDGSLLLFVHLVDTSPQKQRWELRIADVDDFAERLRQEHLVEGKVKRGVAFYDCLESDQSKLELQSRELPPFENILDLNAKMPEHWSEYVNQMGSNNRAKFLQFFAYQLLQGQEKLAVPQGCQVILDGHYATKAMCRHLGFREEEIPEDPENVPILVELALVQGATPAKDTWKRTFRFVHELRNSLGETDFSAFFYVRALRPKVACIISTDTDFIWYGLSFLALHDELRCQIYTYRSVQSQKTLPLKEDDDDEQQQPKKRKGALLLPQPKKVRVDEWVHVNTLFQSIAAREARLCVFSAAAVRRRRLL